MSQICLRIIRVLKINAVVDISLFIVTVVIFKKKSI